MRTATSSNIQGCSQEFVSEEQMKLLGRHRDSKLKEKKKKLSGWFIYPLTTETVDHLLIGRIYVQVSITISNENAKIKRVSPIW